MKRLIKAENDGTIKLIHGTNSTIIEDIFKNGLTPVGYTNNAMFNYTDYNRDGEPKHAECIYLGDDVEIGKKYSQNSVKHNGGFPVVIEVNVEKSALTWDDDAFYKNFGDFDLGEKDESDEWVKKPKKELWEQSLEINQQCAYHGVIKRDKFTRFYLNEKWISVYDFIRVYNEYDKLELESNIEQENPELSQKEIKIKIKDKIEFILTIVDRNIFLYQLKNNAELNKYEKSALSLKIMEFIKKNLKEFGAKIFYTSDFKTISFNPKVSSLNYAFGRFQIDSEDNILEEIEARINRMRHDNEIFEKIVELKAEQEEFDFLYEYSIDFSGDLIEYCEIVKEMSSKEIIDVLQDVKHLYNDNYGELDSEISYLKYKEGK